VISNALISRSVGMTRGCAQEPPNGGLQLPGLARCDWNTRYLPVPAAVRRMRRQWALAGTVQPDCDKKSESAAMCSRTTRAACPGAEASPADKLLPSQWFDFALVTNFVLRSILAPRD
jgi:hypothetical protein